MVDAEKLKQGRSQCTDTVVRKLREIECARKLRGAGKRNKDALKFDRLPREARESINDVERFTPVEDPSTKRKNSKKSQKKKKKQKMHP